MRAKRLTAALGLALLTAGACTDPGQPSPPPEPVDSLSDNTATSQPPPPDTQTETATATASPSTGASGAPELPTEATEQTEAGAEAFVAYYFDLLNYGAVTPDDEALAKTAKPDCETCVALNDILVTSTQEQIRSDGPIWQLKKATIKSTAGKYDVQADFVQLNPASVDFDGSVVTEASAPIEASFTFNLVWEEAEWLVQEIG